MVAAVPGLLMAMGLSAIFIPAVATIVAGLFMLLIKTGVAAYCEL